MNGPASPRGRLRKEATCSSSSAAIRETCDSRQRADAQSTYQLVHAPRGHPGQVGVGNHCDQCGLGPFTAFKQPVGEVRASTQFGDGHINRADPGVQVPVPIAIALNPALGAGLTLLGAAHRISLGAQQGVITVCSRLRIRSGEA